MVGRHTGHIRWFSYQKRYGRIRAAEGSSDIFVRRDGFREAMSIADLEDGGVVEFSIQETSLGPVAVDVVVLGVL